MRVSLICHASTRALREAAFPLDEPIDSIGQVKAAALAGLLLQADQVWSSPAKRTLQTAAAMQLSAVPEPLLADCDYGCWAGKRLVDLQKEQPEAVLAWLGNPCAAPHGGESLTALLARAAYWLEGLDSTAKHVIAITHPAVIRAIILHVLGAGPESFWRIDINPLSITVLRFSHGRWTLRSCGNELAQSAD